MRGGKDGEHMPHIDSDSSIANVIMKYHLECADSVTLMGFGISLQVGFLIYLVCCSHLLDTLGRRRSLICGLVLQILLLLSLEILPHTSPLLFVYLLQALFSVGFHLVYYAGWLYFLELTPPSRQSLAIILANCGKSTSMIVGALMF